MTAARTGRKQPSIRTLWAIAKSPELHLTDEDLHAVVYRETGKESISPRDVAEVSEVIRENGATPEQRRSLGDRLASDAAVAQVIRAANVYRDRLGYGPIESEVEA